MGIKFLNGFLKKSCSPSSISKVCLSALTGKKIAVDVSIYLYKFTAENKLIERLHLMLNTFHYYKIVPVFIFDGKPPKEKKYVLQQRRNSKVCALNEYNRLQMLLNTRQYTTEREQIIQKMELLKTQFVTVNKDTIERAKELLRAFGATYYDSPEEADALCAMLVQSNKVWGCLSDDMDLFAYGSSVVLREIDLTAQTVMVYTLQNILNDLGVTLEEFTTLCIFAGTDYNALTARTSQMNIYHAFASLNAYKQSGATNFRAWLCQQHDILNAHELNAVCNMFDLQSDRNKRKFDVFQNVKIMNGQIMHRQLAQIYASLPRNPEVIRE
jgi:5'-3' exonuclease